MKLYSTEIKAVCPVTGELLKWSGPRIPGISFKDAENYCQKNGLGYCEIVGELIAEIPVKNGNPDFKNITDYENIHLN